MTTENAVGVQTRAMTEAQLMEGEVQRAIDNNQEGVQGANPTTGQAALDPTMNPTVELHKNDDIIIEEYIRRQGAIGLDWYVPDFANTRVRVLIKNRVKYNTQRGRILFNCPPLNKFFPTSTFELDLTTGRVYTFLTPSENIGIPCQQQEFDLELLAEKLQKDPETNELCMEELERIPLIKKIAAAADTMDLEEVKHKICQYLQLWILYAEISVELKRKSKLSKESAVTACKVYGPYISDILRQVDEVIKLFSMEKELRIIKNRGHFPVPKITPKGMKIKTTKDKEEVLKAVDTEIEEMMKAIRRSEENYEREQEEAKNRDQQLRLTRQTNRSDFNFFTMVNSTPIRNGNTRTDQPAMHFDTNTIRHYYPLTNLTTNGDRYEPPTNDSIIQGATTVPGGQFATNTTGATGHNEPWRYNNGTNMATHTNLQAHMTRQANRNGFQNNSPNSSDNRNGPTCYRCGEQGHMKIDCKERVYCTNCKTANHDTKACRRHRNSIPSPINNHILTGYHPTATPPPLIGATTTGGQKTQQTGATNNGPLFQNLFEAQIPRINATVHTPFNGTSPAPSANMTEAITQILVQVTNNNKQDNVSKQMMKNIKIFNGTNKAECITWLSQMEVAARFSNKPFRKLICQSMAPSMLHVLSELSAVASDEDIKNAILTNYLNIKSTIEAATRLQNIQTSLTEPLVTFNHRYEAIHRVAFGLSPSEQYNKTIIIEYAKKLPQNARDKLLRKVAKKNSYIRTLDDAFKQEIEINRETSFIEAASGQYNDQTHMKIETQVNELDDSFQDCDINVMNTRAMNRSSDG